ncbi:MAG: prepilin-type N-terminal cleavage/methylation domain-containing protein [Oscillibacter sp.]|jgi:prepilin-type N-terminal cleavage/methylation domain-containing protein|nr:prepilin-type N-terminal cleavage/methylation domain-containing protein [Oscillibacter sp.]
MKGLREKLRNHEGFTLVEMLIVVAIIAILIAVSIPLVNTSLEKARHAVDQANMRSAVLLANVEVMTNEITANDSWQYKVDNDDHQAQGSLVDTGGNVKPQCAKCKEAGENALLTVDYTYDATTGGSFSVAFKTAP